jgi:hypothetical protein
VTKFGKAEKIYGRLGYFNSYSKIALTILEYELK